MESDSRTFASETPREPLIQLVATTLASDSTLPFTSTRGQSSVASIPEACIPQDHKPNTMAESVYSYYGDSDAESLYADAQSDVESVCEAQCQRAQAVRYLQPGKPSIVDLMRAEKPVFKRASQMVVRRPIERPFISPIQPPKNYRRSFSPGQSCESGNESESSEQSSSGRSSEPSTPILDEEDGATTPTSEGSPSTPDTPKSSFEQEHRFPTKENVESHSSSFKSKMSSRLRMFPKRSTSMNVNAEQDSVKQAPQLPPLFTQPTRSSTNLASYQLSSSPESEPVTAKHVPSRSIWRDAGKSKFLNHKLRRVDSRVGLNVH